MELNGKAIKINQYINGELSDSDLSAFEDLLKKDKNLMEEVNFHKEVDAVLMEKMSPVNEFKEEEALLLPALNNLGSKHFLEENETTKTTNDIKETPPSGILKPTLIKSLIPIALLAAAAMLIFVFVPFKSDFTNATLANNNFQPFGLETVRSAVNNPSIQDKAQKTYNDKKYNEALPLLEKWVIESPGSPKAWLAKGSAEYNLNKLDDAITSFSRVVENTSFKAVARWYMALTYLKKGDKEQAKAILIKIEKEAENYEEANKLLKQIDRLN